MDTIAKNSYSKSSQKNLDKITKFIRQKCHFKSRIDLVDDTVLFCYSTQ